MKAVKDFIRWLQKESLEYTGRERKSFLYTIAILILLGIMLLIHGCKFDLMYESTPEEELSPPDEILPDNPDPAEELDEMDIFTHQLVGQYVLYSWDFEADSWWSASMLTYLREEDVAV